MRSLGDNKAGRRLLQAVIAILSLVPISTGGAGVLAGASFVGATADAPISLDSHFRYLSGIFLALGLVFVSTIPAIERRTGRFRVAATLVVCGGLGRLVSWTTVGVPGTGHLAGLGLELVVVPLLVLWQARVARQAAPPR